jgi:hypothetical protein
MEVIWSAVARQPLSPIFYFFKLKGKSNPFISQPEGKSCVKPQHSKNYV